MAHGVRRAGGLDRRGELMRRLTRVLAFIVSAATAIWLLARLARQMRP
jgi:hypothetical protein